MKSNPVKLSLSFISPTVKGFEGREFYYFASIELPAGGFFEVVQGSKTLTGTLVPREKHTLELTIKSVRTGQVDICGRVTLHESPDDTSTTGDEYVLASLSVDEFLGL